MKRTTLPLNRQRKALPFRRQMLILQPVAALCLASIVHWLLTEPAKAEVLSAESPSQTQDTANLEAQTMSASEDVPTVRLSEGPCLNKTLNLPSWFSISLSGLSQSNTTVTGLNPARATTSNLVILGLQLGPFSQQPAPGSSHEVSAPEPRDSAKKTWEMVSLNALLTQRAGNILSDEIPNILNLQWNYGNAPIARLNILSIQYSNPSGFLSSVKVGKLMQAQDFTVNPVQCYFSNFGLCGWAQGTPYMVPIPGNPFNSYGGVVQFGKESATTLKYGIYQLAPTTFAPQYHGLNFRTDQGIGTAHFMELKIPIASPKQLPVRWDQDKNTVRTALAGASNAKYSSTMPAGTLTLGGWMAFGEFEKVSGSASTTGSQQSQNNGIYGIASTRLPGLNLGLDHRVFVSAGLGTTPQVQDFSSGGSAGLVIAGILPNRPFDTLSLGSSYATYNRDFFISGSDNSDYTPGTEVAIEINYTLAISQAVSIMPNMQLILSPGGNSKQESVLAAGLQVWLMF